jgi:hypothetical protein
MIIKHRNYSIRLGEVGNYLDAYGEDEFALHEAILAIASATTGQRLGRKASW